jgi:hypothetical protein
MRHNRSSVHVSAIAVKLSIASGEAPSKPTFCSASAMPRRRPFFANSSVVTIEDACGDDPSCPSESIVCGDCKRCRLAWAPSWSGSAGRFRDSDSIDADCYLVVTVDMNAGDASCEGAAFVVRPGKMRWVWVWMEVMETVDAQVTKRAGVEVRE